MSNDIPPPSPRPPAPPTPVAPPAPHANSLPPATQANTLVPAPQAGVVVQDVGLLPGTYLTSVAKKFGSYLLDVLLMIVTLGIGWLIWGAIVAGGGQTPARQILGMRVVSERTLQPLGWAQMVFLRGVIGGFIQALAFLVTLYVLAFMPVWDRRNQTVCDKVSSSIVVDDPTRVYG